MNDRPGEPTDGGRWMSDRDAVVRDAFHEDFYDDPEWDGEIAKGRSRAFRAFVGVVICLLIIGGIGFVAGGGDDDDPEEVVEDPEPLTEPEPIEADEMGESDVQDLGDGTFDSPETPGLDGVEPEVIELGPAEIGSSGDPVLDQVLIGLGVDPADPRFRFISDAIGDLLDSISANRPTFARDDVDIVELTRVVARMSQAEVDRVFNNSTIECGATEPFRVVCPAGVLDMPAGDVFGLGMRLGAPVPDGDPAQSFIYSAVFDSDGDPANDWVFNPPFDFDLFQGADRWYQLAWDHQVQAWTLTVSQVGADQRVAPASSAVRAVIAGDHVLFFVPEAEVGAGAHRLTAFGHDGAFSESDRGADVSGVDPTEPLTVPDLEPIETQPLEVG